MKSNVYLLLGTILLTSFSTFSQTQEWRKFVALESTRKDIEKVLGKPYKYFETSGGYETKEGKFYVWYSRGGCHKNGGDLQYNVPAQRMIQLIVNLNHFAPLKDYFSTKDNYTKTVSPFRGDRFWYTSPDESIIYETVSGKDSNELVYSISIVAAKDYQHLNCKNQKILK